MNIDADPRNSDWIKTLHWEFSTDAQMFLWQIGGAENLAHFFTLPAAEAMPDSLRVELAMRTGHRVPLKSWKFDEGQERDANGRWTSGGGSSEAAPTPMTDKEFTDLYRSTHAGVGDSEEIGTIKGSHAKDQLAVESYIGSGYVQINGGLRAGYAAENVAPPGVIEHLDDWTHSDTLDRPTLLYRTGSSDGAEWVPTTVGTQFTDHGYISTSATADYAPEDMSHNQGITIQAPQGTPFGTGTFAEREVILPRDSTFEVAASDGKNVTLRLVKAG